MAKTSQNRGNSLTSLQIEALRATSKGRVLGSGKSTYELIKFYQPIFDKLFSSQEPKTPIKDHCNRQMG
jgi:hypothetical protein